MKLLQPRTVVVLLLFSLADLVALGLHGLNHEGGWIDSRFFHIARDRGLGEILQYLKMGLVLLVVQRWRRLRPSRVLKAWVLLLAVLLLDDMVGLHEEFGKFLVNGLPFADVGSIRAKDLAEMLSLALVEGLAALWVLVEHFKAAPSVRGLSRRLAWGLAPLVLAGTLLDIFRVGIFESLGEMAAMTWLCGLVYAKRNLAPDATG